MTKTRKLICLIMTTALTFCTMIMTASDSMYIQAASEKKAALKAYKKILQKSKVKYAHNEYNLKNGTTKFAVQDINHDGIPELILYKTFDGSPICILTCSKKKVKLVADAGKHGDVWYFKKGTVYETVYSHSGIVGRSVYKIIKGKAKEVAFQNDQSGVPADMRSIDGPQYYIGNKSVTKAKYDSFMKKLTNSTASSRKKLTYHSINAANLKRYLR